MKNCTIACNGGEWNESDFAQVIASCAHENVSVSDCHLDSTALAVLRGGAYPDLHLQLTQVMGAINLEGAHLRELVVAQSSTDSIDVHNATFDRVRIAPTDDPLLDAYAKDAGPPAVRIHFASINARGCHSTNFALLAADVGDGKGGDTCSAVEGGNTQMGDIDLRHIHIDNTLDLTWTHGSRVRLGFADVLRLEGPRVEAQCELNLFGIHASQASLAWTELQSLKTQGASVDRALSLDHATIHGSLEGSSFSAGALVFNHTSVGQVDLSYAHLGLLDIDSLSVLGAAKGVTATGLRVDSIGGDVEALTGRILPSSDVEGAFHSIETALRSGGRYAEANRVAFEGSKFTALAAAKLPTELTVVIILLLLACCFMAAWCCRPVVRDPQKPCRRFLCALDIVLPSFVDIGALSAWSDYDDAGKKGVEITIDGRRRIVAFFMRIVGTMAFTYLLLYVTTLRG
jgi:hypothetical protein